MPAIGAAAALMTTGIVSDLGLGIAAGGLGIIGYTMPAMMQQFVGVKAPGQLGGGNVKLLSAGAAALQRAQQAAARSIVEF
ncbi:hypothetical protein ES703_112501 [subsurface metagenome]